MRATSRDYFDALYERSNDPWRIAGNWYEQRKRGLVTAMLPRRRFRHAFEPACGSGELTVELGRRCDRILAGDCSATAVDIASERWQLTSMSRRSDCVARFAQLAVPDDWPRESGASFDLIVLSEFAYYLEQDTWQALPQLVAATLAPDGVLLACHWKHGFAERLQETHSAHQHFHTMQELHHSARYEDQDFLLELWSREPRSLAQLEQRA